MRSKNDGRDDNNLEGFSNNSSNIPTLEMPFRRSQRVDATAVLLDSQSVTESVSNILPLAREYGLSAYDAAYLDVAIRHGAPLATLDSKLQRSGEKAGIEIFTAGGTRQ
jgi:predicted nucleic acid-binding protein